MSRKSLGRSLLDILRQLGVRIDKKTEEAIIQERDAVLETSTADIVTRMHLAPPEVVQHAVAIAHEEGSSELLQDQLAKAQASARETRRVSTELNEVAAAIAKK